MMATFKDGRFTCKVHGDLGAHDEAIENETVVYSGEDQIDGWFCMACLGEPTDRPDAPEPDDEEVARQETYLTKAGYPPEQEPTQS